MISTADLEVSPSTLSGAHFQEVEILASSPMSVHVPYLVIDPSSGLVVNGTTLHFGGTGSQTIQMLAPSNTDSAYFLLGEDGRTKWPLRETNQSWAEWFASPSFSSSPYSHVQIPVFRENRSASPLRRGLCTALELLTASMYSSGWRNSPILILGTISDGAPLPSMIRHT